MITSKNFYAGVCGEKRHPACLAQKPLARRRFLYRSIRLHHNCIIFCCAKRNRFFSRPGRDECRPAAKYRFTAQKTAPYAGAVFLPEIIHITFTRRGFRFYRKAGAFPDKLYRRGLRPHPRPRSPCVRILCLLPLSQAARARGATRRSK